MLFGIRINRPFFKSERQNSSRKLFPPLFERTVTSSLNHWEMLFYVMSLTLLQVKKKTLLFQNLRKLLDPAYADILASNSENVVALISESYNVSNA